MKIKLEMDRERAICLMRACEVMARIGMGQFGEMVEFLNPEKTWDERQAIERYLKEKLSSDLSPHGYNSMHSKKVPEDCQVAWDAYQHIRREIAWYDKGLNWRTDHRDFTKDMMGVNFDEPFKAAKLNGDFKTERID